MGFIGGGPVVEEADARFWIVREPLVYQGDTDRFVVPVGFRTDFASVPRAVVWLIPRYGVYTRAAILHDFLVRSNEVSRLDADGLFRRALREAGVSVPRRWMMWAAVRFASGLTGASAGDVLRFLLVAVLSVSYLAVPVAVVLLALLLFWLVELMFWAGARLARRTAAPPPGPQLQAD
ncbi:DUF1353 domain-containing protein [Nocardia sp. NPDC050406]|uniref:DUF1353 domain-containing protein n=1 Tax=Nocardia sp. NPDC050406 TaxID=3364318 RepID=UPI00378757F6